VRVAKLGAPSLGDRGVGCGSRRAELGGPGGGVWKSVCTGVSTGGRVAQLGVPGHRDRRQGRAARCAERSGLGCGPLGSVRRVFATSTRATRLGSPSVRYQHEGCAARHAVVSIPGSRTSSSVRQRPGPVGYEPLDPFMRMATRQAHLLRVQRSHGSSDVAASARFDRSSSPLEKHHARRRSGREHLP
jgi:hypothetical protein